MPDEVDIFYVWWLADRDCKKFASWGVFISDSLSELQTDRCIMIGLGNMEIIMEENILNLFS